jgi:hypothetical protein
VEKLSGSGATVEFTRDIEEDIEAREDLFDLEVLPKTPEREAEDLSVLEIDNALAHIGE